MTTIPVLLVDDQLADSDLLFKSAFGHCTIVAGNDDSGVPSPPWKDVRVRVHRCSGQRAEASVVRNDAGVVAEKVRELSARGERPCLALVDVRFDSGRLDPSGVPEGAGTADERFGFEIADLLASVFPDIPVVFFSSFAHRDFPARDSVAYLSKFDLTDHALAATLLRRGRLTPAQRCALLALDTEIAAAPSTLQAFLDAFLVAPLDVSVLLTGATGTGKEVIARYLHRMSTRRTGPFVGINVAAVPRDLFEATFFGHERGAFTGAVDSRIGAFEQAEGGTLFLDEVGDLPSDMQVKLLRAMETRAIRRVGGRADVPVNLRLVAATNRAGPGTKQALRDDFVYRLRGQSIHLRPLIERKEDILLLSEAILKRSEVEFGRTEIALSAGSKAALLQYAFPGNVRELEQVIRTAVSRAGHRQVIDAEDLQLPAAHVEVDSSAVVEAVQRSDDSPMHARGTVSVWTLREVLDVLERFGPAHSDSELRGAKVKLASVLRKVDARLAAAALEHCRHPVSGRLRIQPAMQLLFDDPEIKGVRPWRLLNQLLDRPSSSERNDVALEQTVQSILDGSSKPAKAP